MPVLLPGPGEPLPLLLANTVWADRSGVHDNLETPAALTAWLDAVGPLSDAPGRGGATVRRSDLAVARRLRAAIRTLAAAVTDDPRPAAAPTTYGMGAPRAASVVSATAALAPAVPRLHWPEQRRSLEVPRGVRRPEAALAAVAGAAVALFALPDAGDVRACLAPGCVLYFVKDHPRREWCGPACGNRARAARHYRRHRG